MALEIILLLVIAFEIIVRTKVWDAAGSLVTAALEGCGRAWTWMVPCFRAILPILRAPILEVVSATSCWVSVLYHSLLMGHVRRQRRRRIVLESSKRTQRVLSVLDMDEIGDDEMELVGRKLYVRCAVLISRRARMGLKYPSYSPANERIAADWILKHLPDDMTVGVRHKVLPLAVKLTFVRSHYEDKAALHFNGLKEYVDFSRH